MVVSTAKQLENTYLLWQRFSLSKDGRSWDAVAVPAWVGDRLNSAFTVIISIALVQFWTIVLSLILYFALKPLGDDISKLDPVAVTLWNKRGDLGDSVIEMIGFEGEQWARPWLLVSLLLALVAGVAKIATTIVVAPLIILDHAAPVNPEAIYAPDNIPQDNPTKAARFALEAPRFFRALGSAEVDKELRQKVKVSPVERMGQTDNGEEILRVDYSYGATGEELGIQKYFDLMFNVSGSCVTEYGWLRNSSFDLGIFIDTYDTPFDDPTKPPPQASLFDGSQPTAKFYVGSTTKGTLDESNATWGAIISSVDRKSFTVGTDPWYITETKTDETEASNVVSPGRPVLSCWQDDVWTYRGHRSTTNGLNSSALPGLDLSESLQGMLAQYLGVPTAPLAGSHLQTSALRSATTALEQIFDAGASSFRNDLERLVLTAYVATVNCLTDTTLYPNTATHIVSNAAIGDSGIVPEDVGYVVWSPEVVTLSTLVIIVIPTIFVAIWFVSIVLVYWTPLRIVTTLDSSSLQGDRKTNNSNVAVPSEVEGTKQTEKETKAPREHSLA